MGDQLKVRVLRRRGVLFDQSQSRGQLGVRVRDKLCDLRNLRVVTRQRVSASRRQYYSHNLLSRLVPPILRPRETAKPYFADVVGGDSDHHSLDQRRVQLAQALSSVKAFLKRPPGHLGGHHALDGRGYELPQAGKKERK